MTQLTLDIAPLTVQRKNAAGNTGYQKFQRSFIRLFGETARYHHRHEVFRDLVAMGTLAMQNAFLRSPVLEEEYLAIAGRYQAEDMTRMAQLIGCIAGALDCRAGDFLGEIFMELEIGSTHMGQFFTSYSASRLMAKLTFSHVAKQLERHPFIKLDDPTCGAGSMVIAVCELMLDQGINPQQKLYARCTDIDAVAVHMYYLQLSYLGVPADVVVGNSLTLKSYRSYRTPMWYIGNWGQLLAARDLVDSFRRFLPD